MSAPYTSGCASQSVFSTPELLESVLEQLPLRSLLVDAQRVNQAWLKAITTSPALQQKLFFEPRGFRKFEFNPLLQHAFPPWFDNVPANGAKLTLGRGDVFEKLDWNRDKKTQGAYARREASWRRMLPVQSPAMTLQVIVHTSSMGGGYTVEGDKKFENGVRMGALYDMAYCWVATPITSFSIEWPMFQNVQPESSDAGVQTNLSMRSKQIDRVTMTIHHITQCCVDMDPDVPRELRSEGHEELEIKYEEKEPSPWVDAEGSFVADLYD